MTGTTFTTAPAFGATRRRAAAIALLAGSLLLAGCGTRLSDEDRAIARGSQGGSTTGQLTTGSSTDGGDGSVTTGPGETTGDGTTTATSTTGGPVSTTGTDGSSSTTASSTTGQPNTTGSSTTSTSSTTGGPAPTGSTLVLGNVGTFSGPSGAAWIAGQEALKLWVRDVNSRGGIDGHPVKLLTSDDQGDPARHFSTVKDMVENKKVFAFLYSVWSNTESTALLNYLKQNNIPVVGTDNTTKGNLNQPTIFPQGISNLPLQYAVIRGGVRLKPTLKRYGQLTCLEAPACAEAADIWWDEAPKLGLDRRARAEVSIGQPDFTAECLNMAREQVQLLAVAVDPNSMRRLARSCAQQNYRPTYLLPTAVIAVTQNGDANFNNAVGIISTAPWTVKSGPGPASMHAARERFNPRMVFNLSSSLGWAAGKLFERGAVGVLGPNPSRQKLIDKLYTLRNETLGGLTAPMSFIRGRNKPPTCWFTMQFLNEKWGEANSGRYTCP